MRTTVTIDDELLATAMEYTGVTKRATVIRMALESLVAREAGRRLARLRGTDPDAWAAPRHRHWAGKFDEQPDAA
jgi:Arc/MetJ family transcription regulator